MPEVAESSRVHPVTPVEPVTVLVTLLRLSTAIIRSPAAVPAGTRVLGVTTLPWLTVLPTSAIARIATGATLRVVEPDPLSLSVTVRVTTYGPATA